MRRRPVAHRLDPSSTSGVRTVIDDLQQPIEHWAFTSGPGPAVGSWREQIVRDRAEQRKHLNALRDLVKEGRPQGISQEWLRHLDRLEADLSIARRWGLVHKRIPAHRPSEARFRAECKRVMKRHGIGPDEVATLIVKRIAPRLPKWVQTALIGDWKDERQRIKLLANRVRKPA